MDRQELSRIAHTHHPVAAPLDDSNVAALLRRAVRRGDERILDLGCGEAPWLLRALAAHPGLRADGVDTDAGALTAARAAAERLGVISRLGLHHRPAAEHTSPHRYDLVLSVGASHAFGGLLPTLAAAEQHLAPGGQVLLGEGYWQREPDEAALAGFGGAAREDLDDLPTLVDTVTTAGWLPVFGHQSSQRELDDYEWCWTGSLTEWALDHPTHPAAPDALTRATTHRTEWLRGYQGTFGFVTLLLRRAE
ncbi:SAM-dependent methyltransferase [Streptomyces tateyamensis]|uniref:SAM-dependent methyltransferase n=1 Tax=Streptomyces tateyamensis TaxID=565073 RepID=A0A2V4PK70_9ACTN|nr:class I SAM-dependent methyltransferase [Streptomyces tateyamensis]PYC86159.1 SAM-dependent methyltransferase [Streptomyces tateyamensis]